MFLDRSSFMSSTPGSAWFELHAQPNAYAASAVSSPRTYRVSTEGLRAIAGIQAALSGEIAAAVLSHSRYISNPLNSDSGSAHRMSGPDGRPIRTGLSITGRWDAATANAIYAWYRDRWEDSDEIAILSKAALRHFVASAVMEHALTAWAYADPTLARRIREDLAMPVEQVDLTVRVPADAVLPGWNATPPAPGSDPQAPRIELVTSEPAVTPMYTPHMWPE